MKRVLLLWALAACGGKSTGPSTPPATEQRFELRVGGSVTTPAGKTPLVLTKEIRQGDALYLTITTTKRTKLFVAYCDSKQHLAIYPPTGNLIGEPGILTRVPQSDAFITDTNPGLEHIFVIATSAELDRSDPNLFALLERAQGAQGTQCSPELAMSTEQSRGAPGGSPTAAAGEPPVGGAGVERDTADPRVAELDPTDGAARFAAEPSVWRPRGFAVGETSGPSDTSSSSSDEAGIAIWAITLVHK